MQPLRVCHCGKCDIKCNKHGKRAKCSDCGKVRMLGTIVEHGIMRHACNECCVKAEKELENLDKEIWKELRNGKDQSSLR